MYPHLLHIYGPLYINSYGTIIALAIICYLWCINRDPRRSTLLTTDQLINITLITICIAIIGARILYIICAWNSFNSISEMFALWQGGFAVLGSLIAVLCTVPLLLRWLSIPILPLLDLAALYAPLLQGISRLGCFFAGCCYGIETSLPWAVTYQNVECAAPLHITLHPTQLYSTVFLITIFMALYFFIQKYCYRPGQLMVSYILLESIERFSIDFLRADRSYFSYKILSMFSLNQWICCILASCSLITLIYFSFHKKFLHRL